MKMLITVRLEMEGNGLRQVDPDREVSKILSHLAAAIKQHGWSHLRASQIRNEEGEAIGRVLITGTTPWAWRRRDK